MTHGGTSRGTTMNKAAARLIAETGKPRTLRFEGALDASYDELAHGLRCPRQRKGGDARKWLTTNGHLEQDEAELLRSFSVFAGRAGSHTRLSGAADARL